VFLQTVRQGFAAALKNNRGLAALSLAPSEAREFFTACWIAENGKPSQAPDIEAAEKRMAAMVDFWHEAWREQFHTTVPSVRHTAWDALNVVTEYHDHMRGRGEPQPRAMTASRLNSNLLGASKQAKSKARELALAMI